jgi:hypothetical protein
MEFQVRSWVQEGLLLSGSKRGRLKMGRPLKIILELGTAQW